MNTLERQQIWDWIRKNTGISLFGFLLLSFLFLTKIAPVDNFLLFIWLFFGGQVLLSTVYIILDVFGHQRVIMVAELKEKTEILYRGNAKNYEITLENEEHHRTFTITQDQWERLELGVIYEMVYLKNSHLVLALKPTIVEMPAPETPTWPRFDTLHGENE